MTDEYVSNPRLAILAEELRILNESMIAQNLHSTIRLCRLRQYAEATKFDHNFDNDTSHLYDEDNLPLGISLTAAGRFRARLTPLPHQSATVGTFDSIDDAIAAYQVAHIKQHGEQSPYYEEKHAA